MLRLLKTISIFLLFFLFLAAEPVLAGPSLLEALKDPSSPSLQGLIAGYDTIDPQAPTGMGNILIDYFNLKLLGVPNFDNNGNFTGSDGGVINGVNNSIASLYNPPAAVPQYLAYVYQNSHFGVKTAHALEPYPGGTSVFSAILHLWRAFRNIAYIGFIIIFVILGFMIMFRAKLNPQTAISIQTALPKIIIGLIGVTFSYAIAALILDISQIANLFIFKAILSKSLHPGILNELNYPGAFDMNMFSITEQIILDVTTGGIQSPVAQGTIVGNILNTLQTVVTWITLGSDLNFWGLILAIVLISNLFKIFFMLLTKYIQIIFGVIFSPLVFFIGSLPGSSNAISNWFRSQLAHVLVFPATFLIFAVALILYNSAIIVDPLTADVSNPVPANATIQNAKRFREAITPEFTWVPDVLPFGPADVAPFISFGIIMIIPNIGKIIENALQVKEGPGAGIAENIRGVTQRVPLVGRFM